MARDYEERGRRINDGEVQGGEGYKRDTIRAASSGSLAKSWAVCQATRKK